MDQNGKVEIGSEYLKLMTARQIEKLVLAIQIEKKCSRKTAVEEIIYFLKQVAYLLTNEI